MKRVAISALIGAVVFSILTTWLGPKMIGWYVTPGDQPAALSCQAAVIGAMHRLVQTQMVGTLIGAVVGLVGQGMSNRAVAAELGCSESTVELHVTALLDKSQSESRSQLVARLWSGI